MYHEGPQLCNSGLYLERGQKFLLRPQRDHTEHPSPTRTPPFQSSVAQLTPNVPDQGLGDNFGGHTPLPISSFKPLALWHLGILTQGSLSHSMRHCMCMHLKTSLVGHANEVTTVRPNIDPRWGKDNSHFFPHHQNSVSQILSLSRSPMHSLSHHRAKAKFCFSHWPKVRIQDADHCPPLTSDYHGHIGCHLRTTLPKSDPDSLVC